jgi:AraC-like DNA-binding protein
MRSFRLGESGPDGLVDRAAAQIRSRYPPLFANMKRSRPLHVTVPAAGVLFAESVHGGDFRMAERTDPFHKLLYVLDGKVNYREPGGARHTVERGSLVIVPRLQPHAIDDLSPSTLLLLCWSEKFLRSDPDLPQVWEDIARIPERRVRLSRPGQLRLEQLWRRALLEKSHGLPAGAVTLRALAAQILVMLSRLPARTNGDAAVDRVAAVAREVEETFYDSWDLDRAAARAGLSRRRFSELFRDQRNETFLDCVIRLRLEHAVRLLKAGEHSILGVMFSCGFNDLSHFYRLFRARFGHPPKRWLGRQA